MNPTPPTPPTPTAAPGVVARLTRSPRLLMALLAVVLAAVVVFSPHAVPEAIAAAETPAAHGSGDAGYAEADPSLTQAMGSSPLRIVIQVVCGLGFVVIIVGLILCIIRALLGPHIADRVIASDLITLHIAALTVLLTIRLGQTEYFDVVLVVSLISFAGTIAFAQFLAARAADEASQAERQAEHDAQQAEGQETPGVA